LLTYVTLDSPDGAVTFHETDKRALAEATGLVGLAGVREVKHLRPTAHGTVSTSKWLDGRGVSLKGEVWGADGGDAWAEWSALAGAMYSAVDTPRLLKWGIEDGPELQAAVRSLGGVEPTLDGSAMLEYLAQFWADDPRAYAQGDPIVAPGSTLSVSAGGKSYPFTYPYTFNASSGGTANLVVAGVVPTPPVIRVYGYAASPLIRLESTGEQIKLAGEVAAGRYVEIDTAAVGVKVRLDDGTPLPALVDYTATTFFELPTGPQTLSMFASAFDATARPEARYRPAYL
jgi:hypothetical protein